MPNTILKAENINKQYRLGVIGTGTLSNDLKRWWFRMLGKEDPFLKIGETNDRSTKANSEYVWALRDINFEVNEGEVLGIIGKNGAGKSTLLKILSRVTGPTTGVIKTKGRIASLLEVGTGFHPEMTGRENIFLNGAILGMTKAEIKGKENEIIDFSGCHRYIDTPVKRYSSGMRVRLAFAVAAHLEPDILVIDEVLAVGDAEFQKKAIGKMQDISTGDGRTVLFVSHNMAAVKSLCNRAIVLEHGKIVFQGDTDKCINYYLNGSNESKNKLALKEEDYQNNYFNLQEINIKNKNKEDESVLLENEPIVLTTKFYLKVPNYEDYHITYHLYNEMGTNLFGFTHWRDNILLRQGDNVITCEFPKNFFQSGQFFLTLLMIEKKQSAVFIEKDIFNFTVVDGNREIGSYLGKEPGYIRPNFKWENQY